MIKTIKILGLTLLLIAAQLSYGQSNKEKARALGQQATKLEDEGKYDDALRLLREAEKLEPKDYNYPYEIGYTYYLQKDYQKALDQFKKVVTYKNATNQCYQMLGNIYDITGDSTNAVKTYNDGLKLFPKSGNLYLELGNIYWNNKEYGKALPFYEKGIEVDPEYPSIYYRAARIYCGSNEEVWGMIYGEIFMNLERNSKRTSEISKLLYDTYKSEIKFTNDSSFSVSFSKNATMNIDDMKKPGKMKLPYGVGVYEPTLMFSMLSVKTIDINALDIIRSNFVDLYFKNGHNKTYPNILFTYQKQVKDAGHMEAYNHWILMKGDEDGFEKWLSANKVKWDNFIKWFGDNAIVINDANKFYRSQY